MRGQQNIVVTVILILAVLGILYGVVTWFQSQTKTTQEKAGEKWNDTLCQLECNRNCPC